MAETTDPTIAKISGVILASMLAAVGGTVGYQKVNPPRPDPYLGSEARAAHRAMSKESSELRKQLADLRITMAELKGEVSIVKRHVPIRWHRGAGEIIPALTARADSLERRMSAVEAHVRQDQHPSSSRE